MILNDPGILFIRISNTFFFLFFALLISCGGGGDAGDTNISALCEGEEVSVGQDTEEEEEECATIAVFLNLQDDSALVSTTSLVGEAVATVLDNELSRAGVLTSNDASAASAYSEMLEVLAGEDPQNIGVNVAASFSNAEIIVVPTLSGDLEGTLTLQLSAFDSASSERISLLNLTGTATEVADGAESLGEQLADDVKNARVCLNLTPVRTVIDFDDEDERQETFTAAVKNLKDENLTEGTIVFSLENGSGGNVSPESASISNGTATTVFTMTKRQADKLTATYAGEFAEQTDDAIIIPLCGFLLTITGNKVFDLNQETPSWMALLFGEDSWLTINGTSTVDGAVALTVDDEIGIVYGTGWMTEEHSSTGAVHTLIYSPDMEPIGSCDGSGTAEGTATGVWLVSGTKSDNDIHIDGLALGVSPVGSESYGSCSLGDISASGSSSGTFSALSEFSGVDMTYEEGATAHVTGEGSLFLETYTYTLTLKRAAP